MNTEESELSELSVIKQISQQQQSSKNMKTDQLLADKKQVNSILTPKTQIKEQASIINTSSKQLSKEIPQKQDIPSNGKILNNTNKVNENKKQTGGSNKKPESSKKPMTKISGSLPKNQAKDKQITSTKKLVQKKPSTGKQVGHSITKLANKPSQPKKLKQESIQHSPIKKFPHSQPTQVQISISSESLSPIEPSVTLISILEQRLIVDPNLIKYYRTAKNCNKFIIWPIACNLIERGADVDKMGDKEQKVSVLFSIEMLKKFGEQRMKYDDAVIYYWIVQLFYELYLETRKNNLGFAQIDKNCIYIVDSPFLNLVLLKNNRYIWDNPLRILLTSSTKDQISYLSQMTDFGQQFQQIHNYSDLYREYLKIRYEGCWEEMVSVRNVAVKLRDKLASNSSKKVGDDKKIESGEFSILTEDMIKWVAMQISEHFNYKFVLYYKGSYCNFEPSKFWEVVLSNFKQKQNSQFMLIEIEIKQSQTRLIGFYSNKFPQIGLQNRQIFGEYIIDSDKKSILFNLSEKTVHHLNDSTHSFMYNNQILLCIGKCDVVLSAFNITNLCYFPVSFDTDHEGICQTAEVLCGGKKFKVKEVYVYRFTTMQ